MQPQMAMRTQHREQRRPQRDQAAAAELLLVDFAVLEQLWIKAEVRVDEEHPIVDEADLHGICARFEQQTRRGVEIRQNAVVTAEVVKVPRGSTANGQPRASAACATAHSVPSSPAPTSTP